MKWKKIIDENCDNDSQNRPIPSLLVQNKVDLIDPNQVKDFQKRAYLDEFAIKNGFCGVCLTSAKDNKNIEECFQQLLGRNPLIQTKSSSVVSSRTSNRAHRPQLWVPATPRTTAR